MPVILKKILWVENRPILISDIKSEAAQYGLDLVAFDCWDSAYEALENNFDSWSAIVLQPKSQLHPGSYKNIKKFLPQAFMDMHVVFSKRGKTLPWYILADSDPNDFSEMILESREDFDGDWPKPYYDCNDEEERQILYTRIQERTLLAEKLQVCSGQYKRVFSAITYLENHFLSPNVRKIMTDLLVSTAFGTGCNRKVGVVREILEYIFCSMMMNQLLPYELKNTYGKMNNDACSKLLSGKDVCIGSKLFKAKYGIMNYPMPQYLYNMLKIGNSDKHAATDKESIELDAYINEINSDYLLESLTLQLCDILLWYELRVRAKEDSGMNIPWWTES